MSIALWSTNHSEVTGQAIVTRRVARQVLPLLGKCREYVFPPTGRPVAIAKWMVAWMRLWFDVAFQRIDTLYLVCSRSNAGFLRDVPALLTAHVGIRVIVHCHGSDIVDLLTNRRLSGVARWFYSSCEMIVPSTHLRAPLEPFLRSVYVCEGFCAENLRSVRFDKPASPSCMTVLWNSNVMASKGFFDLFAAVEAARSEGLDITLISLGAVIGDAELAHDTLKKRFASLGSPSWFDYKGQLAHEKSVEVLGQADAIALPSRFPAESQGIAIIEAMCAGKAIIASDIPALRATLGSYPAEFVPVKSVDGIKQALCRVYLQKKNDPVTFSQSRTVYASEARERFSVSRFDREISDILVKNGKQ